MLGKEFSDLPPKVNINKLSLNKIKNFCSQKDLVKRKRKKEKLQNGRKYLHVAENEVIFRILKTQQ